MATSTLIGLGDPTIEIKRQAIISIAICIHVRRHSLQSAVRPAK
jgi:hypothetical protein